MEGKLFVVGIGPGDYEQMTIRAAKILESSDTLVGYSLYIDLVREHFPGKEIIATGMTGEAERCRKALERAAEGHVVSIICSGDAGIYGMASLVLEMAPEYPQVQVQIVPGVTAACSGGALLGAPLGHDFAVISLSDRLTSWQVIEKRLRAAADSDMAVCLYNPASRLRPDYLGRACRILLDYRKPETVCGVAENIGRDREVARIMTLGQLAEMPAGMFMTVFVGSSETKKVGDWMVSPRGYKNV